MAWLRITYILKDNLLITLALSKGDNFVKVFMFVN